MLLTSYLFNNQLAIVPLIRILVTRIVFFPPRQHVRIEKDPPRTSLFGHHQSIIINQMITQRLEFIFYRNLSLYWKFRFV